MAETIIPGTAVIALPADLDSYEEQRTQLEADGQQAPDLCLPTLADAQRAARRLAEIRRDQQALAELYDAEEQRLRQEIEALRQRREQAMKPFDRRASWYEAALEAFHREQLRQNPRAKTIRLPAGDLCLRAQQPEWDYGDEDRLADWLALNVGPQYVRKRLTVDKAKLKKAARVIGGRAVLVDEETGEMHELPITVTERPPKFEFKPAE